MVPPEEKHPAPAAEGEVSPDAAGSPPSGAAADSGAQPEPAQSNASEAGTDYHYYDDAHSDYSDGYTSSASDSPATALATATAAPVEETPPPPPAPPAKPPSGGDSGGDGPEDEEEGMTRMSFFEHLEELRRRIFYALGGLVVAFLLSLTFANKLWDIVAQPAVSALQQLKVNPPELAQIAPLEYFNIVWIKLPLLSAIFLGSPWLLYQLWAFIAPGLYKKERRWATPFVISTAGLFVLGGLFAYYIVFRFALVFLLGLGIGNHVRPLVSVEEYFSIFVNVMLGVGLVFELPVLIFFLVLIRVMSTGFLMRHIRYAILAIFIIAAVVTPTPDVFNMVLFATPMCLLFFVGIGAGYLLEIKRDQRRFPWGKVLGYTGAVAAIVAALMYLLHARYGYHFVRHAPWFGR